jgi:hypothetical protein
MKTKENHQEKTTNITQVEEVTPIVAEDLKVSILAEGSSYLLGEPKGIPSS